MDSVCVNEDITFCTSDCDDMKCERNSKHIHHREIPHSYADLDGDKRFCRKVQNDEKEYQPGVWYGADVKPPEKKACIISAESFKGENKGFVFGQYVDGHWVAEVHQCNFVKYWMMIPDIPKA